MIEKSYRHWAHHVLLASLAALMVGVGLVVAVLGLEGETGDENRIASADALVLMAGASHERLPTVARLYHEGVAPRILLTNDGIRGAFSREHQRNLYHVEWDEVALLKRGIPPEAIAKLHFIASGTVYDALNTRAFVRADGSIRSLLVVTSDYHTRRTLWSFEQVFADDAVTIGVVAADSPQRGAGERFRIHGVELLKSVVYRIWHRVHPATFRGETA